MHTQHSEGIVRQRLRQTHIHTGSPAILQMPVRSSCFQGDDQLLFDKCVPNPYRLRLSRIRAASAKRYRMT
jgi:hypothetical protein